jgi:hypothetical protein
MGYFSHPKESADAVLPCLTQQIRPVRNFLLAHTDFRRAGAVKAAGSWFLHKHGSSIRQWSFYSAEKPQPTSVMGANSENGVILTLNVIRLI